MDLKRSDLEGRPGNASAVEIRRTEVPEIKEEVTKSGSASYLTHEQMEDLRGELYAKLK
jgi:hypothetical protein